MSHAPHTTTKTTLRNCAVELLTEAAERCTFLTGLGVALGKVISGVVDVDSAQVLCVLADLHDEHLVFEETVGHMVVASNNYLHQQCTRERHINSGRAVDSGSAYVDLRDLGGEFLVLRQGNVGDSDDDVHLVLLQQRFDRVLGSCRGEGTNQQRCV